MFSLRRGPPRWDAVDDVWEEHGTWSPFCLYVRFIKGRQFVEECPCDGEQLHRQTNYVSMFTTANYVC